jgi:hypothetical protein
VFPTIDLASFLLSWSWSWTWAWSGVVSRRAPGTAAGREDRAGKASRSAEQAEITKRLETGNRDYALRWKNVLSMRMDSGAAT